MTDVPAPAPAATQSGHFTLYLQTHGLGCSTVRLRVPQGQAVSRRMPFRLGPLECEAVLTGPPSVGWSVRDGLTTTDWSVELVGVPAGFVVADLLEALGCQVTR